jgi:hypothetical protein
MVPVAKMAVPPTTAFRPELTWKRQTPVVDGVPMMLMVPLAPGKYHIAHVNV